MRFLNWDVLLFPDESKVPIPEFDVKCYALPIPNDASQPSHLVDVDGLSYQMCVTQIPTLTGFIPSLDSGRTFRVSVHSWERPQPSDLLQQLRPDANRVNFEAKLYIDGKLKAQKYFEENCQWPQVIDCTPRQSYDPLPMPLQFPPFRSELLQQSHWDAGDDLSRIRLVITEGIIQNNGLHHTLIDRDFDKIRDVVVFSFQHAPKRILEYSGIAWPNARMFQRASRTPTPRLDMDAHAHSPQKAKRPTMRTTDTRSARKPLTSPASLQCSKWATKLSTMADDPFVVHVQSSRNRRKTSDDIPMPDYTVKVNSSKNPSEMSEVAVQQLDFAQQLERAAVGEIFDSLSPAKKRELIDYVSTSKQAVSIAGKIPKTLPSIGQTASDSAERPYSMKPLAAHRRLSTGSRRSVSGQSTSMSWEGTPTLGDIWTSTEYPGLLATIQSQPSGVRSNSSGPTSKRKRSASPSTTEVRTNGTLPIMKGMSTSPCKGVPIPTKITEPTVSDSCDGTSSKE